MADDEGNRLSLELLQTAVRDIRVQQRVRQLVNQILTRCSSARFTSTRMRYRVGVRSQFFSPSNTWSSTVKPIDSATVSRPAYPPSGSSPVGRLQTSGSGSPSVCSTSKTGTGRKVATTRVKASQVSVSVSAATRRVMGARIQMACSPRRTTRPSCPGLEPGNACRCRMLRKDQEGITEAVLVEAGLRAKPGRPGLRAGQLGDTSGEAVERFVLASAGDGRALGGVVPTPPASRFTVPQLIVLMIASCIVEAQLNVVAQANPCEIGLSVTNTVSPNQGQVGDTVTYSYTVTNDGNVPFTDVQVDSPPPSGVDFVSASDGGIVDPDTGYVDWGWPVGSTRERRHRFRSRRRSRSLAVGTTTCAPSHTTPPITLSRTVPAPRC